MALSLDEALGVAALDESDKSIHIDLVTRQVVIPESEKLFGVESDDAVEVKHIVIDGRYTDAGKDISELSWRVNFRNANGDKNVFPVTKVTAGDDSVEFDWIIRRSVVAYKGSIDFVVCAFGKDSDGKLTPEWNSTLGHGDVLEGLEVDAEDIGGDEILDELKNLQVSMKALSDSAAKSASDALDSKNAAAQIKTEVGTLGDAKKKAITDESAEQQEAIKKKGNDTLASIPEDYQQLITDVSQLKEGIDAIPKKQGYLSSYVTDSTIKINNEIYDATTIIDELLKNGCKKIVIDVDCYVQKPIILNDGIEIVGNGKSIIYFESGDGFNFSKGSDNTSIHDLIIKGYNIQDDVNVKDNWLINISSDLHNVKLYSLDIESGYNGIKINGRINNYQNIIVSYFKGIGVYIGRSDNTFNTFYINGCRKEGLYISSSNNRIDNIKILSCGKNSDSSCYFKGSRNTISNVEIQDIYNKCAIFKDFNNNILNINLDGIRTHITDDTSIVLAEFVNCSRNVVNLISSKYGSSVKDSSNDDIISLNSNCSTNSLILSSLKVTLQDDGVKNNITVLKNDIVSYNIDKILALEETYSTKKPTVINYVECSDISNEYDDAMYAFKNSGAVSYSGLRFKLKEKQKLFCVAVLSSNIAYTEQVRFNLTLSDQQGNTNNVKSIGNLEKNQVLTLIGADDASLKDWAVLNTVKDSSAITKIKYIGFFDFQNYSAIMSDIIN